jgi:apolipoprotein N-acyltransferase
MEELIKSKKLRWGFLLVGFLAFFFSSGRWNTAITAWIWPAAFLCYSRSTRKVKEFLPLVALIALGNILRWLNVLDSGYIVDAVICMIWSVCWILPFIVDRLFYKQLPACLSTMILPGTFVTIEFLTHFTMVGSYGVTAYTQSSFPVLVQSVSLIGCFGLTFIILWFGPVLLHAVRKEKNWKGLLALYMAVLCSLIVYGGVRLHNAPTTEERNVRTASIVGPYYQKFSDVNADPLPFDETLAYFKSEVDRAVEDGAKILCWNEEAFDILENREDEWLATAKELAKTYDLVLILPYEMGDMDNSNGGLISNKLMIIQPDGSMTSYFKTHMVPVTEAPYYVKGNSEIPSIRTKHGVLTAIICFDDSYISFMHGFGAKVNKDFPNTDILFAPSWDWEDIAEAHSTLTKFRAVENGYALVKPTYDGISVAIDRYGRELLEEDTAQIGYDSVCCVDVPVAGQQTFYGRWGNVIDPALACVGVILLIAAVIRMKVVKPESP